MESQSEDADRAVPEEEPGTKSRRRILKLALAGAGGAAAGAAALVAGADPASAANGNPVTIGAGNTGTAATELDTTGSLTGAQVLFQSGTEYSAAASSADCALGAWATDNGQSTVGLYAYSNVAGGSAIIMGAPGAADMRFFLDSSTHPTSGTWNTLDIVAADDGLWICLAGGSPGTWARLAGTNSAGAFTAITPHRVYDSRHSSALGAGTTRTVSVANGINAAGSVDATNLVPAGATAISVNVTIAATTGAGYLTLYPAGASRPTASTLNWTAGGQTIANAAQLAISSARDVSIYCAGGSTQVILDVNGYYL